MSTSLSNYGGSDGYKFYKGTSSPIPNQVIVNSDNVTEGSTNLYFTTARARSSISAGGALTYNSTTGEVSYTPPTILTDIDISHSDDSTLGSAKSIKTYVDSRVQSNDDLSELSGTLDDITAGTTNKHFTATDETKLDGIETGAEVNVNADWDATSGDAQILNKPSTFSPSSHTHTLSDITDSGTAAPLNVASSGDAASGEVVKGDDSRLTDARTPSSHTHAISEVTNLQTSLDAKQATVTAGDGLSFSGSTLNAEVTQAELDAKAASSHTHTASEITDFDTEVANNSAVTANTAKVSNVTHTGDATGSGALTVVALQGRSVSSSAPSDGQVLKWNNSASEWQAMADNNSGGGGGGGTPAGSTGQIQFNSGGSFGADSNLVWDDSNNRLGIGTASPSSKLDVDGKAIIRDDLDLYSDYCIQYWNKANGTDRLGWILNRDDNSCQYMWADGQPLMFGTVTTGGSTTERMRIDSSGTLTSTSTSTDAAFLKSSHANNTNVYINNTNATTGNTANLYFGPANNVSGAKISAIATEDFSTSANRSADLALSTRNNGNWVEAMRIDSGGLVGIGTTGPTEKLHIAGAGTQRLLVEETGSTVKTKLLSSTTAGVLATATDHPLGFDTNDQRRMTLTSTGLGIGPTSPSANLHISDSNPKLRLQDDDETNVYTDIFNQSGDTFFRSRDGSSNGIFTFNGNNGTSDTEFLRIGSNGNVGIGTNGAGSTKLHIEDGTNPTLRISNTTNNNYVYLQQQASHAYLFTGQDQKLTLGTNNNNHLTISTGSEAGYIGVGTTSPSSIVHASQSTGLNFQANSRAFFGSLHSTHFAVVGGAAKADDSTTSQMVSTETASSGNGLPSAIKLGAGNIDFHTASSSTAGAAFDSLRLRLDSSGNVKVGNGSTITASGDADDLVIDKGAADTGLSILSTTTGRIYFGDAANEDAGSIRYVHSDDSMRFETDDTERMRIDDSGRVHVRMYNQYMQNDGTTAAGQIGNASKVNGNTDTDLALYAVGGIELSTGGSSTPKMTLNSSGNCGIGTTSPSSKLHVAGQIQSDDSFRLTTNVSTPNGNTMFRPTSNTIAFGTDSVERMRIASTGRVTVKKSSNSEVTVLTDGATITPDLDDANNFSVTLGGNRTLANPSNCTAGQSGIITITQDGTGSRTLAYGAYWKFSGGTAPTLTTTASAVDVLAYYVESATRITATLITDTK